MTTKASNAVLNLTDPPIDAANIVVLAVESVAAHDVLIGKGASPVTGVAPGTSGKVLTSNGPSADPTFQDLPAAPPIPPILIPQLVGPTQAIRLTAIRPLAAATLNFIADQIIVVESHVGDSKLLPLFNQTINLSNTGVNGMDIGSLPVTTFVAVYAIWNPDTETAALVGTLAGTGTVSTVYTGAHMPSGYTMSGLISIWATDSNGFFVSANQVDDTIIINSTTSNTDARFTMVLGGNATAPTALIAGFAPFDAREILISAVATETAGSVTADSYAAYGSVPDSRDIFIGTIGPGNQTGSIGGFWFPTTIPRTIYYLVGRSSVITTGYNFGYKI